MVNKFILEQAPETFHRGIIPTIPLATHGNSHAKLPENLLVIMSAILAPSIRVQVGIHRIKRIRKKLGLRCKQKRKFKVTTDSKHNLPVAPNRLDRQFAVTAPNKAWVTDITYIATDEG